MQSKQPNLGAIKIRLSILAPSEKVAAAEPKARTELRRGPRHYGLTTPFLKADNDCLFYYQHNCKDNAGLTAIGMRRFLI